MIVSLKILAILVLVVATTLMGGATGLPLLWVFRPSEWLL